MLLEREEVDAADLDNDAIIEAATNGHLEVVELLLEVDGVNPGDQDNAAIKFAAENGHFAVVDLLIDQMGVNVEADGNYALKMAAANGHEDVVKFILDWLLVDMEELDFNAITEALLMAGRKGHAAVVSLLINGYEEFVNYKVSIAERSCTDEVKASALNILQSIREVKAVISGCTS
ncbi:hypothetical protein HDU76_010963 [Blyttiomyces sp. JEL0837]|nr:hypothetical protein HDU76_010963 [Blyttiomyces sp. JEL0837]